MMVSKVNYPKMTLFQVFRLVKYYDLPSKMDDLRVAVLILVSSYLPLCLPQEVRMLSTDFDNIVAWTT